MPAASHVAVNAAFLDPDRSGGPETYLRGLVPALAAARPDMHIEVITSRRGAARLTADGWNDLARIVRLNSDEGERLRRLLAEELWSAREARRRGAQLLHSLASLGPARARIPHVVSLHDVTFFHMRTFGRATTIAMRLAVRAAARGAAEIIAVSAAARGEIVATLGIAPERITVVPLGAGQPLQATPVPDIRERLGLSPGRIVLCVAAVRPHKNQGLLVRALEHLPADITLVLAGVQEPYADELRLLGHEDRVHLVGYVKRDELEGLWRTASCAAFPTRAEGFGLPVLEALQRGLPVACSDIPVLREVGGEIPHYFDPDDPADAAQAILAALAAGRDPRAGAQAARFTWEAAAEKTLDVYDRALSARA